MTIHKSQGGTYGHIVYEYDKIQTQQLVYVALSRITNINALFILTKDNNRTFHHGLRVALITDLQAEFRRLHLNELQTLDTLLIDFMTSRRGVSFCSFNCQILRAHFLDMGGGVIKCSNFLLLTETWILTNDFLISILLRNLNVQLSELEESPST